MMNLVRVAGYLWVVGIKNRLRRQLRRMRQPRHFFAVLVGVLYVWWIFGRRFFVPGGRQSISIGALPILEALMVLSTLLSVAGAWLLGSEQPALSFSEAEVHFLFPAPITRRMLLHYRLSKSLFGTFLSALVSTALFGGVATGHPLHFLVGSWLAFFTLTLHLTGATLTRGSLVQHGKSGWKRRWATLLVALAVVGVLVWFGAHLPRPPPLATWTLPTVSRWVTDFMDTPPLSWVLLPIRAPIRVAFAQSPRELLAALTPAAVVAAIHYFWVLSSQVAFEEASAEYAEQRARLAEAKRASHGGAPTVARRRKALFPLAGEGRPETALVWKSSIAFFRGGSRPTLAAVLVMAIAFTPMLLKSGLGGLVAAGLCLVLAGLVTLLGPDTLRIDLRQDIRHIDLLRSFPLSGRRVLLAEALGPTLMLGALQLALLLAGLALSAKYPLGKFTVPGRLAVLLGVALFLPTLTFFNLLVRNGAVLIMPSWMAVDPYQTRGLEMMGQRLLLWMANLLVMIVAVLPSCLVGGLTLLLLWAPLGFLAAPLAGALAASVMMLELLLGLQLLGKLFDGLDISA